ncbi:MAG: glycosyltransferase, partial [Nitrospirota bacterium]
DDRHRFDALEIMAAALDGSPDIGLVYADQIITETENETFERHTPAGNYRWIDYCRELLTLGCFIGPQPMWRKSLHDSYGYFDETFTASGDWEFWLRIAEGTKMLHIPENLGLYFRSPISAEHRNPEQKIREDMSIFQKYVPRYLAGVEDIERALRFIDEPGKLMGSRAFTHLRKELLEWKKTVLMGRGSVQDMLDMSEKKDSTHPSSAKSVGVNSLHLADELNQKGRVDDAVAALLNAIRQSPSDKRLHNALVDILIENKRFKDGLDILNNMPEEMRKGAEWHERHASCSVGLDQFEDAERHANEAIALGSTSPAPWNIKGFIAFKKGNRSEAERLFKKAIEYDKGFGEAYCNLAGLRWLSGDKEDAVAFSEKAFILSPAVADVALSYYTIAANLKQFDRAADLFREATALHPLNKKLKFTLIDILLQQAEYHQAMKETEEALLIFGIDEATLSLALGIREKIEPSQSVSISLCMIVKNEEQNIARALSSVKPVVDEMIVVDTGSTDRTKDIAKAFGAKVYDFAWTDSFSDARNFSLSKASGKWILVLDADEVISAFDHEKLRELIKGSRGQGVK